MNTIQKAKPKTGVRSTRAKLRRIIEQHDMGRIDYWEVVKRVDALTAHVDKPGETEAEHFLQLELRHTRYMYDSGYWHAWDVVTHVRAMVSHD